MNLDPPLPLVGARKDAKMKEGRAPLSLARGHESVCKLLES